MKKWKKVTLIVLGSIVALPIGMSAVMILMEGSIRFTRMAFRFVWGI